MATKLHDNYLIQLDRKLGVKNRRTLIFSEQCAAHPQNTFFSKINSVGLPANYTSQLQPLYLEIIHAFKCQYRK
jgi:hypothetical protein